MRRRRQHQGVSQLDDLPGSVRTERSRSLSALRPRRRPGPPATLGPCDRPRTVFQACAPTPGSANSDQDRPARRIAGRKGLFQTFIDLVQAFACIAAASSGRMATSRQGIVTHDLLRHAQRATENLPRQMVSEVGRRKLKHRFRIIEDRIFRSSGRVLTFTTGENRLSTCAQTTSCLRAANRFQAGRN